MKKPTSKHEDDKEEQEKQEEMFTPVKHTIQVSDSPKMDPPLKPPEKLLSKVTKEEPVLSDRTKAEMAAGAAAVKAEEEKLAAREKAERAK